MKPDFRPSPPRRPVCAQRRLQIVPARDDVPPRDLVREATEALRFLPPDPPPEMDRSLARRSKFSCYAWALACIAFLVLCWVLLAAAAYGLSRLL